MEDFRGGRIGKKLMESIVSHPDLKGLRRMGLGTDDAHGLYQQFGFSALSKPGNIMERLQK
ncbi:GNAT family N-acetyltransferase [uncultured Sunxiuqinia sp.]|uniref:GNAT family N-acetyltransferase n=1 Tax=uncultured Sunxiuqinia sp. TaxID=1573825 RepID=UPI002AA6205D|nr:GNAT family N-acetyltransferase [uncultured Sunxiuqinia sp.]